MKVRANLFQAKRIWFVGCSAICRFSRLVFENIERCVGAERRIGWQGEPPTTLSSHRRTPEGNKLYAAPVPNIQNIINVDAYWTYFWPPNGCRWQFKTKLSSHFEWCVPRLFYVVDTLWKHTLCVDSYAHSCVCKNCNFPNTPQKTFLKT